MPPRTTTPPVRVPVTPETPVWRGPCDTSPQGGVTVSLLQKFLSCRYRFKTYAVDGWKTAPKFNHRIEYGNFFHLAEESFARDGDPTTAVELALDYAEQLSEKYPESRAEVAKWWNVLRVQFPEYVKFWSRHSDTQTRTPLLQEQVFDVPYRLPSGRVVRLRGKWDGVDLVDGGVWLVEHKTKGEVDEVAMQRQLTFDIQVMTYLVALQEKQRDGSLSRFVSCVGDTESLPILGVHYNVVRRPLSGGEGDIKRHEPTKSNPAGESETEFYARLRGVIDGTGKKRTGGYYKGPSYWFYRWQVDVTPQDVDRFKREFLNPCLEFMCNWYRYVTDSSYQAYPSEFLGGLHWRTPYGLTSEIVDGYGSDLDHFMDSGSSVGLTRVTNLFPELKE